MIALRVWVGSAGSERWRRGRLPGDPAAVEEHAEPVVREPFEAMAAALDLLDEEVEAFGGPFEAPVSWCARISVPSDEGAASSGWSVR